MVELACDLRFANDDVDRAHAACSERPEALGLKALSIPNVGNDRVRVFRCTGWSMHGDVLWRERGSGRSFERAGLQRLFRHCPATNLAQGHQDAQRRFS